MMNSARYLTVGTVVVADAVRCVRRRCAMRITGAPRGYVAIGRSGQRQRFWEYPVSYEPGQVQGTFTVVESEAVPDKVRANLACLARADGGDHRRAASRTHTVEGGERV